MNYASTAQADLFRLKRRAEDIQRLANPFPGTVTLREFVLRDLNPRIAAGDCAVYGKHLIDRNRWLLVKAVERPTPLRDHYIISFWDRQPQHEWGGFGELRIDWHVANWKTLSMPMRRALYVLAGNGSKKPRANTLRALEKRGLVVGNAATPFALSLYQMHKGEFEI